MGLFGSTGLRAGVIGTGSVAETAHIPAYLNHPKTTLAAVAELDEGRRESVVSEYDIGSGYRDGKQMLEEENLDLVSICTPAGTHRDLFLAAAKAGCHIYCEKPLTTSIESAERMAEAAAEADVITQIGYTRAYVENYQAVLAMKAHHLLGDIKRVRVHRVRSPPAGGWNFDPEMSGGGVVADQLGHILDFYIRVFDTAPDVKSVTLERLDIPNVEDYAEITLEFDGVPVELLLHWTPYAKHHRNLLVSTRGLLEFNLESLNGQIQGETVAQKYGKQPFVDLRGEFRAWWGGSNDFHDARVTDFIDHVLEDNYDTVAPIQRGVEVTQIIADIYNRSELQ